MVLLTVTEDAVEDARERMQRGPNKSVKKLAVETGVSYGSVHKILRNKLEVEKFKYLGATVTNINETREEIKHRINMGNACYYSVEKLLSSSLLSKNLKVRIYKTVILPVVLYGCETWTPTLREEHRLRVFKNKILRKIFGAKRDEVTGEWRKLHNTELHALYSSPDIIRNIKSRRLGWAGHVARMGESRNASRVLVGRPEGKRPLGRPRRRWEDNIKMDLREAGYDDREWINFAQDSDQWRSYVRAAMNLRKKGHLLRNAGKKLRKRRVKCFVWSVAFYGAEVWILRRSEEKRIKAFEIWICRRMERVKWTDKIRNGAVLERVGEERMMLKLISKPRECGPFTVKFSMTGAFRGECTELSVEASKSIGLEVNPEMTKYMIMSRDQNIVRNGNIKIGDLSFEEVEKFKYLGATVTNINDTREEIKRRINMGNACYYSVEKLLSSSLLSKNLKVRIYKTVILPVLLYGCETWTVTLREEHRLRVFENKVLRKIFGAKQDEVTGEWRKLHNTELHALYSSPDIIRNFISRRLRWAGHVARMGESRNAYGVLVGRPEGKRPLGRPRRRWEDNIKMDFREVGYDGRDWINLAQDRDQRRAYVRAAMNLRVP
ncbi:hypothetical protein ANN_14887 [Periplaneta americana]|uniref:Endonuclease-reverse transcriptase n=1 Tax=Periplaneta americana TaxID=6978 RepID=A0ABQ8SYT5_PERAM|nr:hypothetical protein ANN_14887 [Periplaneta americana]